MWVTEKVAMPSAPVTTEAGEIVEVAPPPWLRTTVAPDSRVPVASATVTVTVAALTPFATTGVPATAIVEVPALGAVAATKASSSVPADPWFAEFWMLVALGPYAEAFVSASQRS